jgi:hypothetical protein
MIDALQNGGTFVSPTTTTKQPSDTDRVSEHPVLNLSVPKNQQQRYSIRAVEAR